MNAFHKYMTTSGTSLALLNVFGGIVAGIWLAVLGEWGAIGWGMGVIILTMCSMSIALLPTMALDAVSAYFEERGHTLVCAFFAFLRSCYTVGTIALWCGLVVYFFASLAEARTVIPLLLWSYAIATGPFAWVAVKEGHDDFASLTALSSAEAGYVIPRWHTRADSPSLCLTCVTSHADKHVARDQSDQAPLAKVRLSAPRRRRRPLTAPGHQHV